MRRTRLYNTSTGKWEYWAVKTAMTPWRVARTRLRAFLRHVRRHGTALRRDGGPVYAFDPETLDMRDQKMEGRMRRRERRDRFFAKAANALNAMIEMQKHIG